MKFLLLTLFFFPLILTAQDSIKTKGIFYRLGVGTKFIINDNFGDELTDSENQFIVPDALILNNAIGYQINQKIALEAGIGYTNIYSRSLKYVPLLFDVKYRIASVDKDPDNGMFFARASYGSLLKLSDAYENGWLYRIGLGIQVPNTNDNSYLIALDFNSNYFKGETDRTISMLSLSLDYQIF